MSLVSDKRGSRTIVIKEFILKIYSYTQHTYIISILEMLILDTVSSSERYRL